MDTDGYVVVRAFIDDRLKKDPGQADHSPVLSFVGGGGKTSYIRRLAWEGREKGCRVLVMTTTHMAVPEYFGVLEPDLGQVEKCWKRRDSSCRMSCQRGKDRFPGLGVL